MGRDFFNISAVFGIQAEFTLDLSLPHPYREEYSLNREEDKNCISTRKEKTSDGFYMSAAWIIDYFRLNII